mgnify:CR=1 FL=1
MAEEVEKGKERIRWNGREGDGGRGKEEVEEQRR